jgi:hypothetical protein
MKKLFFVAIFIVFAGLNGLVAQNLPTYPIPSFNVELTATNTAFQEPKVHGNPNREKREMDIVISSSSTSLHGVYAKVWVVKDNGSVVKGPFRLYLDHVLEVPIDNGQWGVVINCKWDVSASVWTD